MRLALLAFFAVALLSAVPAAAQINVQLPENAVRPAPITPQALELRRVQLLRAAGVTPPPGGLREATTASVGTPVSGSVRLQFYGLTHYLPQIPTYGSATMRANPAGDISWVQIRFRADAGVRYIVDCTVSGPAANFQFERLTGGLRDPRDASTTTASGGRVAVVLTPAAATGDQTVFLKARDNHWYFHQCEVVPVR